MEKINLSVERSFSDLITASINFVKQEFVPLIRAFVVIGFPVILVVMFLIRDVLLDAVSMQVHPYMEAQESYWEMLRTSLVTNGSSALLTWWVQLFSLAYLRVYWDHYRGGVDRRITIGEVFSVMRRKFMIVLGWSLFYMVLVLMGIGALFVPGIYLSIALIFGSYLIVIKDKGYSHLMMDAMGMVKGIWWKTFGFLLVAYLLVTVISYLFSIPLIVLSITSMVSGEVLNIYETTFAMLLAYLGQYTLNIFVFIAIGMMFFSRLEEKEHATLLSKIDQLGKDTENSTDEVVD